MSALGTLPTLDTLAGSPDASPFTYLPATVQASPVESQGTYQGFPVYPNTGFGVTPPGEVSRAAQAAQTFLGLAIPRIVAIILGLILIGAGLLLFRPTQEIISRGVEAASA